MKDEYISKANIINIPLPDKSERNYITYNHDDTYEQGYQEALDKAASLPSANVAPVVHAYWIPQKENYEFKEVWMKCSACGYPVSKWTGNTNFCPNCGAKMDGKGEE